MGADKFRFQSRLTLLKQQLDDLVQVLLERFHRFALRVRARKTGNVADQKTSFGTPLDNKSKGSHARCFRIRPRDLLKQNNCQASF